MTTIYFATHPEVIIDPAVPVPDWQLSEKGWSRIKSFCARPELSSVSDVFTSSERKATDCAEALKATRQLAFKIDARLGENDRSSTGYVEPPRFWEIVDRFFDSPNESVLGWERAIDAQTRIKAAVADCVASRNGGDICIFSHGGVGTLLLCDLMGEPISRKRGQPISGGGCYFAFDAETRTLINGWQDIALS
ncbi:histidine phosphatase family protein [Brucella anthropi]|uniref:histidine phosphatase family protein n=1 Tax=Brucella anthropi TaxID=529 RepID=UPI0015EFEFE4|nr:histidine phosphatase family protein [Brucella anthropi]